MFTEREAVGTQQFKYITNHLTFEYCRQLARLTFKMTDTFIGLEYEVEQVSEHTIFDIQLEIPIKLAWQRSNDSVCICVYTSDIFLLYTCMYTYVGRSVLNYTIWLNVNYIYEYNTPYYMRVMIQPSEFWFSAPGFYKQILLTVKWRRKIHLMQRDYSLPQIMNRFPF